MHGMAAAEAPATPAAAGLDVKALEVGETPPWGQRPVAHGSAVVATALCTRPGWCKCQRCSDAMPGNRVVPSQEAVGQISSLRKVLEGRRLARDANVNPARPSEGPGCLPDKGRAREGAARL